MKRRKLLTMTVASALVAAQMAMPVMAASGSGSMDIDVINTETVLKVQVPTSMTVAVNEYEQGDASQITSTDFTMINKSGIAVSVEVTSTATVDTGITLAESDEVDDTAAELWLAVAAQTKSGEYGADIADLTAESANVATFADADKKVKQTFYLKEGTGAVTYKLLDVTTAGKVGENDALAEYYALTELAAGSTTGGDTGQVFEKDAGNDAANNTALQTKIAAGDVYSVKTADIDKGVLTKIAKNAASTATYDGDYTYYSVATTKTALTGIAVGKYVYAEMASAATTDGTAAFRYIGKLSTSQTWSNDDVKKVSIAYTINGVGASDYQEKAADCVYGLYTAPEKPDIVTTTHTLAKDTALSIPVKVGSGSQELTGIKVLFDDEEDLIVTGDVTIDEENMELVFSADVVNYLLETDEITLPLTLKAVLSYDGGEVEKNITLKKS